MTEAEGFQLVHSDRCPKCGETELYEPGDEQGSCRVCRGVFLDGDAVRFGNELGTIRALTFEEACDALTDHDEGCDECRDEPAEEEVHSRMDEHWLFVHAGRGRLSGNHVLRGHALIVHAVVWTPPAVGPGHPVYEEALDVVRRYAGASRGIEQARARIHRAQRDEREAWTKVRPALTKLVEAAKAEVS